ncbi:hypothetical protein LINPERPRIM_LOCUS19061, partial [Linum perenne]
WILPTAEAAPPACTPPACPPTAACRLPPAACRLPTPTTPKPGWVDSNWESQICFSLLILVCAIDQD